MLCVCVQLKERGRDHLLEHRAAEMPDHHPNETILSMVWLNMHHAQICVIEQINIEVEMVSNDQVVHHRLYLILSPNLLLRP